MDGKLGQYSQLATIPCQTVVNAEVHWVLCHRLLNTGELLFSIEGLSGRRLPQTLKITFRGGQLRFSVDVLRDAPACTLGFDAFWGKLNDQLLPDGSLQSAEQLSALFAKMARQRRHEPRFNVNIRAQVEVLGDRTEALITDVSESGLGLLGSFSPVTGRPLSLFLSQASRSPDQTQAPSQAQVSSQTPFVRGLIRFAQALPGAQRAGPGAHCSSRLGVLLLPRPSGSLNRWQEQVRQWR